MGRSLIRISVVMARTGKSRSDIYRGIRAGIFPPPVPIGPQSVAWVESEIDIYVEDVITRGRSGMTERQRPWEKSVQVRAERKRAQAELATPKRKPKSAGHVAGTVSRQAKQLIADADARAARAARQLADEHRRALAAKRQAGSASGDVAAPKRGRSRKLRQGEIALGGE